MDEEPIILTVEQAIELLPNQKAIHTMYNRPGIFLGADRTRKSIIESLKSSPEIQITGPVAMKMGYGIALIDNETEDWLFIKTGEIELANLKLDALPTEPTSKGSED